MATLQDRERQSLTRRGIALERATLGWNVAGIIILAFAAATARSVALAGFGLRRARPLPAGPVHRGARHRIPPPALTAGHYLDRADRRGHVHPGHRKARTGAALGNPVVQTEGRVTMIDGILAVSVLAGLVLNAAAGWWWADPATGYVLVYYAAREIHDIFTSH